MIFLLLVVGLALWGIIATIRGLGTDGYHRAPICEAGMARLRR